MAQVHAPSMCSSCDTTTIFRTSKYVASCPAFKWRCVCNCGDAMSITMNVIAKHLFAVSLTLRHLSLTFLLGLSEPIARWSPRIQQLSATAHEIGSLSQVRSGSSTCATPRTRDCPERSLLCSAVRPATHQPVSDVVRCAFRCLSSSVFMSISVVLFCAFLMQGHQRACLDHQRKNAFDSSRDAFCLDHHGADQVHRRST